MSAAIGPDSRRHWFDPVNAVALATAMTSLYAAGIFWLISAAASLPAATTTATPAASSDLINS